MYEFDLDNLFTYHPTSLDQQEKYTRIRVAAKEFAQLVLENTPTCNDQSVALRCIREAVAWANASIALDGRIYKQVQ